MLQIEEEKWGSSDKIRDKKLALEKGMRFCFLSQLTLTNRLNNN